MTLLTIIVALGVILMFPNVVLLSLQRDGATQKFDFDMVDLTVATSVGAIGIWASLTQVDMGFINRSLFIILGALLILGAWIDRISAWSPDVIMIPFCIIIFLIRPEVTSLYDMIAALGFGVALFLSGILLWIPQDTFDLRVAPPADLIAIAAPFVLFGLDYTTAVIFLVTSILLLAALKSKTVAQLFSRPEAVADAASEVDLGEKPAVTFLSVIFPVIFFAVIAKNLMPIVLQ